MPILKHYVSAFKTGRFTGSKLGSNLFDTSTVHAEVGTTGTGCRTNVDDPCLAVNEELDVVDKAEPGRGEFGVKVIIVLDRIAASAGEFRNDCSESL